MDYTSFRDFVSVVPVQVPKEQKTKQIDKLLKFVDKQKSEGIEEIQGLQVRMRASHSARLTGHWHLYAPSKMKAGADTFLKPFAKPILVNHDEDKDPIGRIKSSIYVPTPHSLIPSSIFEDAHSSRMHTSKNLGWVDKLNKFLNDRSFEGLGYLSLVGNITDPDAIVKALDGRYLTVSVGYDTNSLHCSVCKQDWLKDGPCDHEKGHVYKGQRMFFIFGDMTYGEVSYVNTPADELAGNEDVKRVLIPVGSLKDSLKGIKSKSKINTLVKDALIKDSYLQSDPARIIATVPTFYMFDSVSQDVVPVFSAIEENNQGDKMKFSELLALGTDGIYAKISEFLPEDKKLKTEQLSQLKDEDFIGDKLFPVVDQDHISACKSLFETLEDSEDKTQYIDFVNTREASLQSKVDEPKTDTNESSESSETEVEKTDETPTPEVPVEKTDTISYSFELRASNWGLPDEKEPDTEKEKQILEMLLALYAKDKNSAKEYIDKILAIAQESKDEILSDLTPAEIKSAKDSVEVFKKELQILKDTLKSNVTTINSLTQELKDKTVEEILSFTDSKQDPDNPNKHKDFFKDKSLKELKTSLEVLRMANGDNQDTQTEVIVDPTLKHDNTKNEGVDEDQIKKMKDAIENEFVYISRELGQEAAMRIKTDKLNRLNASIIKKDKQEKK